MALAVQRRLYADFYNKICQKQKFTPTVGAARYAPSVLVGAAGTSPSWHNPYKD